MNLEQALQYCKFSKRYKGYKELLDCVNIALECFLQALNT